MPARNYHPFRDGASEAFGAFRAAVIVAIFCGIMLCVNPRFFWTDDNQIGTLPILADIARAWSHGEFPLLSSSSWVSGNLAGEYQAGTFSIFHNLCVFGVWALPFSLATKAAVIATIYLCVLAAGAYLLARQRGLTAPMATA